MNIDIEKFICDCIEKAERSITWENIDENIDGHIFKGALREQGLIYKNGKIYKIGEEPEDPKPQYLVYDRDNDKFDVVSEAPKHNEFETFMGISGTNYHISATDYIAYLEKNSKDTKKNTQTEITRRIRI